jgi:hypothetical protein
MGKMLRGVQQTDCPEQLEQSNMRGYHGGHYQITVFWDLTQCRLVQNYQSFRKKLLSPYLV